MRCLSKGLCITMVRSATLKEKDTDKAVYYFEKAYAAGNPTAASSNVYSVSDDEKGSALSPDAGVCRHCIG